MGVSGSDVTTLTGAERVEILFKSTGVVLRAACTLQLRFAADVVLKFVQGILSYVVFLEGGDQRMAVRVGFSVGCPVVCGAGHKFDATCANYV